MRQGISKARRRGGAILVAAIMGMRIAAAYAVPSVSIGNGPTAPDGSYLNAESLAETMAFTDVHISATSQITIVDNIDLSTSALWGPTFFNFNISAPTFNLNNDLIMGTGQVGFTGTTANLTGKMTSGAALLNGSKLVSTGATQFNVLANTASVQQAIDFSSTTPGITIAVSTGQYNENVTINKSLSLATGNAGGHVNNGQLKIPSASATATITGSSFSNASGGTIAGIGTMNVSGLTGSGFVNHGTVAPGLSPGTLSITGAYNQASDGDLEIEIGGTTAGSQYDRLAVSGAASLDGLLHVNFINGFIPSSSDSFTILTSSARSGAFSNALATIPAGSGTFQTSYTPTSVTLSNFQVPEPAGLMILSLCATTFMARRRRA